MPGALDREALGALVANAVIGLDGENDFAADSAVRFNREDDLATDSAVRLDGERLGRPGSGERVGRNECQGDQRKGNGDADRASVKEGREGHVDGFLVSIQLSVMRTSTVHSYKRRRRHAGSISGLDTVRDGPQDAPNDR
jgi:hypothetical protein